jgi:hypothetical protein
MAAVHPRRFVTTLSGVRMPKMLYGTAWKKDHTVDLVVQAVLAGFRGIDTACQPKHYREDLVGKVESLDSQPVCATLIDKLFVLGPSAACNPTQHSA